MIRQMGYQVGLSFQSHFAYGNVTLLRDPRRPGQIEVSAQLASLFDGASTQTRTWITETEAARSTDEAIHQILRPISNQVADEDGDRGTLEFVELRCGWVR